MTARTEKWLYGLGSAVIGGGAAAVTSGLTTMGFAPDKFNLTDLKGVGHLLMLMTANFLVSGFMSMMFYLRQSPLPAESSETTFTKKVTETPEAIKTETVTKETKETPKV